MRFAPEELIRIAISRAGIVRVRNALNPFLWGFVWSVVFAVLTYIFKDDAVMKYMCLLLAAAPMFVALGVGLGFALTDPDRLQSEEFVIRQQELTLIEKKGGYVLPADQLEIDRSGSEVSDDT